MKPAVCIMGPTASGKTSLAVDMVAQGGFEIINVDSAQIYTAMDIGTAKPDAQTLRLAPHRLLDFVDPAQAYSVAQFVQDATCEMHEIYANGNTPILVGGTMMYFNALQKGLSTLPNSDPTIRASLQERAQQEGLENLYQELQQVDSVAAAKIHSHDAQRIFRALEVYLLTGKPMSVLQQDNKPSSPFSFLNFALLPDDRANLHHKIATRFDRMLEQGLVQEVAALKARGDLHKDLPSMRCVGYRQVWSYLEQELSFEAMRERGIIATRQLAKRQFTWLRSWENLSAIDSAKEIFIRLASL